MAVAAVAAVFLVAATTTWIVPRLDVPVRFWAAPLRVVSVDDRELRVVEVEYASGLRHVDSLGGLDGALFRFDQPLSIGKGMGMAGTLMDLDVVFFDPDGRAIERFTMTVCETEHCPGYYPSRPWQFAIEAPAGALEWVREGAQLDLLGCRPGGGDVVRFRTPVEVTAPARDLSSSDSGIVGTGSGGSDLARRPKSSRWAAAGPTSTRSTGQLEAQSTCDPSGGSSIA